MRYDRLAVLATTGLALAAACGDNGPGGTPRVVIAPILDSLFVGDTIAVRTARYFDASGDSQATGPVRWFSADQAIFTVDSVTGVIAAVGRGAAVLSARANGVTGTSLLVVSRALDLSLLLDTVYLMAGDTFTVPVSVRRKGGSPPPVWFTRVNSSVVTVDSATGRITAIAAGGPIPFTAHADTVSAAGAVEVVALTDTVGGKGSFSVLGTVIRRGRAGARAINYHRQGDTATFRVSLPVVAAGVTIENIVITLRDSVAAPLTAAIDSISLNESGASADFVCRPKRAWAIWSVLSSPPLRGLSRQGGTIAITQVATFANGLAVSGRFSFTGQRSDLYDDPLSGLPVRGTFVTPVIADSRQCG